MPRLARVDASAPFSHAGVTPTGGMRIDAVMSSACVREYDWPDGRTMRELRHPDEVFAPESVASLMGAAVTILHPDEFVTPENYSTLSKGHVSTVTPANPLLSGKIDVNATEAISGVKNGDLIECSCGYNADVEEESGEWEGQKYDAVQRNIRYNHVALGPRDWGRQGPNVALRTDARRGTTTMAGEATQTPAKKAIRVDSVPYDADGAAVQEAIDHAITKHSKRADAAEALAASEKKRADTAEASLREYTDPVKFQARVDARAHVLALAAKHLKKDKKKDLAWTSSDEILKMILQSLKPGLDVSKMTPDQIQGAVMALTGTSGEGGGAAEGDMPPVDGVDPNAPDEEPVVAPTTGDARGKPRTVGKLSGGIVARGPIVDGLDEDLTVDELKRRADEKTRNAWRTPKK